VALVSRTSQRSKRAARPRDRTGCERGDPPQTVLLTKGSRHPDRRSIRSLRGGESAQGLGTREETGVPQGVSGSERREPPAGQFFERRHGVSAVHSKEGNLEAGIATRSFTLGPRPMSRVG